MLYHCGEKTTALVLANMITTMKVRHAGLRRRKVESKDGWTLPSWTAKNIRKVSFTVTNHRLLLIATLMFVCVFNALPYFMSINYILPISLV